MPAHDLSILELRGVSWISRREDQLAADAAPIDLRVSPREITWLEGPAGQGKEAVFRLLSLAEFPETGDLLVEGVSHRAMSGEERARLRAARFGFLAASPFLLPTFSAIENIAVPLLKISGATLEEARDRIARVLQFVELDKKQETSADHLDPLDQARLALARALASEPLVLFVEDLEGTLLPPSLAELHALLRRATDSYQVSVVALSGGSSAPRPGERAIHIADGRVQRDSAILPTSVA